jgi:hypothetical protein
MDRDRAARDRKFDSEIFDHPELLRPFVYAEMRQGTDINVYKALKRFFEYGPLIESDVNFFASFYPKSEIHDATLLTNFLDISPDQGDVPLPSGEDISRAIDSSLTVEGLQELLRLRESTLYFVPQVSPVRIEQAILKRLTGFRKSYQLGFEEQSKAREIARSQHDNRIRGWDLMIGECTPIMHTRDIHQRPLPDWDSRQSSLPERITAFRKRYSNSGLQMMTVNDYLMTILDGCELQLFLDSDQNSEADHTLFTILDASSHQTGGQNDPYLGFCTTNITASQPGCMTGITGKVPPISPQAMFRPCFRVSITPSDQAIQPVESLLGNLRKAIEKFFRVR